MRGAKNRYDSYVKPYLKNITDWIAQGLTEEDICKKLGVAVSTFAKYKNDHVELKEAIKKGRISIVGDLRSALIKKALGYDYTEKKQYIKKGEDGEQYTYTEINTKHLPPDVAAINLALKNYDRDNWANDPAMLELKKQELELKKMQAEQNNW